MSGLNRPTRSNSDSTLRKPKVPVVEDPSTYNQEIYLRRRDSVGSQIGSMENIPTAPELKKESSTLTSRNVTSQSESPLVLLQKRNIISMTHYWVLNANPKKYEAGVKALWENEKDSKRDLSKLLGEDLLILLQSKENVEVFMDHGQFFISYGSTQDFCNSLEMLKVKSMMQLSEDNPFNQLSLEEQIRLFSRNHWKNTKFLLENENIQAYYEAGNLTLDQIIGLASFSDIETLLKNMNVLIQKNASAKNLPLKNFMPEIIRKFFLSNSEFQEQATVKLGANPSFEKEYMPIMELLFGQLEGEKPEPPSKTENNNSKKPSSNAPSNGSVRKKKKDECMIQ